VDQPKNPKTKRANDEAAKNGTDVSSAQATETTPKEAKVDKKAEDSRTFLATLGVGLGRTTRFLGKGPGIVWKGSNRVVVSAARKVKSGLTSLSAKRSSIMNARKQRTRRKKIKGDIEGILREVGHYVLKASTAECASLEIDDKLRELLSRATVLQNELEEIVKTDKKVSESNSRAEDGGQDVESNKEAIDDAEVAKGDSVKKRKKTVRVSKVTE
jgi:DNA-binding ferritin-like protein (Dps family)